MAKMSGPEEFFEAFRDRRPEQTPVRRKEESQPQTPSLTSAARPEKTITVTVRTLTVGIASSILLIVLAYFVGASQNAAAPSPNGGVEKRPVNQQANGNLNQSVQPRPVQNGGRNPIVPAGGGSQRQAPPTRYEDVTVIKVIYYQNRSEKLRSYADEFRQFLMKQDAIKTSSVSVFPRDEENGNGFYICIGPFNSPNDALARKVMYALRNDIVYQGTTFKDAQFGTIKEPVQ